MSRTPRKPPMQGRLVGVHLALTAGEDGTGSLLFGVVCPRRRVLHGQRQQLTGRCPHCLLCVLERPLGSLPVQTAQRCPRAFPGAQRPVEGGGRLWIGQVLSQHQLLLLLGRRFWCYF